MRTQDEIVTRIKEVEAEDLLGFQRDVLLAALDFEHAKPYLKPETPPEKWRNLDEATIRADATAYLTFAWGKAENHLGISASRSVEKMTTFCWLLGLDISKIEAAGYPRYGCPKLKAAAELLGEPLPTERDLVNMMAGDPCNPYCFDGCRS